jgi:hypothetical protein
LFYIATTGYDKFYCVAERLKRKVIPTSVFVSSKAFFVLKLKLIAAPVSVNELNSNWLYQLADAMHATMLERNGL